MLEIKTRPYILTGKVNLPKQSSMNILFSLNFVAFLDMNNSSNSFCLFYQAQQKEMNDTARGTGTTKNIKPCIITTTLGVYMFFYCAIIFLVVTGNAFVLVKIFNHPTPKRTNIELLIMYLSFFDLFTSLMIISFVYENLTCYRSWSFGEAACKMVFPLHQVSLNMSICILIIMSIDRCRSIVTPMRKKFSRKSIHTAVIISLAISIGIQYYQIMNLKVYERSHGRRHCGYNKSDPAYAIPHITILTIRDFLFIIVFTVTSIWIYGALSQSDIEHSCPARKKKGTKHVVIMLITMEVVFALLVLPYDIFYCVMLVSRLIEKPIKVR